VKLICGLRLMIASLLVFASSTGAQTIANGPYYANPSWDQTLPSSTRFVVLSNMNSEAVLDRETGLVWERSPDTSTYIWLEAAANCNTLYKGNRLGWRLPTLQELASLVDRSVIPGPTLPAGHPFQNVQPSAYWSATTGVSIAAGVWAVVFKLGGAAIFLNDDSFHVWCVRGGQGVDPQ
jgi:Protein of unknown function (DUF1566)